MVETNPQIIFNNIDVQKISETVSSVKIELQNIGYLPTMGNSYAAAAQSISPASFRVSLAPTCKIITGEEYQKIGHLDGRSRLEPITTQLWDWAPLQPTDKGNFEWTLEGSGDVSFEFNYVKGGVHKTTITL